MDFLLGGKGNTDVANITGDPRGYKPVRILSPILDRTIANAPENEPVLRGLKPRREGP